MADTARALELLRQRLTDAQGERDVASAALDAVKARIDSHLKRAPRTKPTLPPDALRARVEELEYKQRSTSMSLTDEKKLLAEINALKQQRSGLAEYTAWQAQLDADKAERGALAERVRTAATGARDLRDAIRKIEILEKVRAGNPGVAIVATDLRVAVMPLDPAHLPALIGRKGANLREIEAAAHVVLDVDHEKDRETGAVPAMATVRISGLDAGIAAAQVLIEGIAAQVDKTWKVSDGVLSVLLNNGAAAIKDAEAAHGVRVRVERAEKEVQARGAPPGLAALGALLAAIERSHVELAVSSRLIPAIIGKGGEAIKRLREETGAEVEVQASEKPAGAVAAARGAAAPAAAAADVKGAARAAPRAPAASAAAAAAAAAPPPADVKVRIYALTPAAVAAATAALRAIVEERTEHDEVVPTPADVVSWLLAKGGERIAAFQKERGVFVRIPPRGSAGDGAIVQVAVRGARATLAPAVAALRELVATYARKRVVIDVTDAQARALVGPGGATIKALRGESAATIEVGGGAGARERDARRGGGGGGAATVVIHADDEGVLAGAVARVRAFLADQAEARFAVSASVGRALLADKGARLNAIREKAGGVQIDVLRPERGDGGADESSGDEEEGDAAPADAGAADGGAAAPAKRRHRGGFFGGRGGSLVIAGKAAGVAAALEELRALASAHGEESVPLRDAGIIAEIVGKGGAAIRALREELKLEDIVVDRAAVALRLVGAPEAIAAGVVHIRALEDKFAAENASIVVDAALLPSIIGKGGAALRALQEEVGATLRVSDGAGRGGGGGGSATIRIQGPPDALVAAKARLTALCKLGAASETIACAPAAFGAVIGRGGGNLRKLQEAHRVVITSDDARSAFVVRGEPADIAAVRAAIRRLAREAARLDAAVTVPAARIGALLGAKGVLLRALEVDTGASVDVPRDRVDGADVSVRLRGSAQALECARVALASLAAGAAVRTLRRAAPHIVELRAGSHAARIAAETGARVSLFDPEPVDPAAGDGDERGTAAAPSGLAVVTGPEAAVARAATALDRALAARFPATFACVELPADAARAVVPALVAAATSGGAGAGSAGAGDDPAAQLVAAVRAAAASGASVHVDARGGGVAVWAADAAAVSSAREAIAGGAAKLAALHALVPVDASLVPALIGKKGAGIAALEKETGCSLRLDRREGSDAAFVAVAGKTAEAVAAAAAAVRAHVAAAAARRVLVHVPAAAFGAVIGKAGAVVRRLSEETGAAFDLDRDGELVTVRGETADAVRAGVAALLDVVAEANFSARALAEGEAKPVRSRSVAVDAAGAAALIGRAGATIRALEAETGARINVERGSGVVRVTALTDAAVDAALARVAAIAAAAAHEGDRREAPRAAKAEAPAGSAAPAAAGSAPQPAAAAAPGGGAPRRPIGAPPPTADELSLEERRRAARQRKRERARARRAAGGAADAAESASDDEAPAPVAAAPLPVPVPVVPAAAHTASVAAGRPAGAAAPAVAPAHAAAAHAAAAPVASGAKPSVATASLFGGGGAADDILAALLGPSAPVAVARPPPAPPAARPKAAAAPAPAPVAALAPVARAPVPAAAAVPRPAAAPAPAAAPKSWARANGASGDGAGAGATGADFPALAGAKAGRVNAAGGVAVRL